MRQFASLSVRLAVVLVVLIDHSCFAGESSDSAQYEEHRDLSYYLQEDGSRIAIRTADDWPHRRRHILLGMEAVMGPLPRPVQRVPLDVEEIEEVQENGFARRKVAYHTDRPDRRVRAWLLVPTDNKVERRPAVLCLHQTTPPGKDSPAGLADRVTMHYAVELARRGFVTLSPDYPSLGEHEHDFDADDYASGSMKAIYDNVCCSRCPMSTRNASVASATHSEATMGCLPLFSKSVFELW
jgi:hypothetical protein